MFFDNVNIGSTYLWVSCLSRFVAFRHDVLRTMFSDTRVRAVEDTTKVLTQNSVQLISIYGVLIFNTQV